MDLQVEQADWERRMERLQQDTARLQQEASELHALWYQFQQNQVEATQLHEALREAVLRYAVACAATEVQAAMLRARGDSLDVAENLRRCVEEQHEASNALRTLARTLHSSRPVQAEPQYSGT